MLRSDDRILVTHVGSLPRPATLRDLLVRQDRGESIDPTALESEAAAAIRHVVARQLAAGIDIGNDGEMPRPGFSTYVAGRMRGFGGASTRRLARDLREHPDFEAMLAQRRRGSARITDAPSVSARSSTPISRRPPASAIFSLPPPRVDPPPSPSAS
jgi:5-methyltetrahydropteroyltriglutamate--homocysteine methyltransferase